MMMRRSQMADKILRIICFGLLCFIFGVIVSYEKPQYPEVVNITSFDTITLKDTVFVRNDIFINKRVVDHDTVLDTIYIPITKHHFDTIKEEIHVSGVIEGYDVSLDSLEIECPPCPTPKEKHWSIGPTAGYGVTKDGLSPYVGISIMYNLISF
jgi:hypothetical protein